MSLKRFIPGASVWHEKIEAGLRQRLGDADALLLIPYDDGTFYLKPAYYDKTLVGGIGGYETPDEDKFVVDGTGNAKRSLFGVPIALAIDPSEHAGVVEPIKALMGEKNKVGEWVRVDRDDAVVEFGNAIEPVDVGDVEQSQKLQEEMQSMVNQGLSPDKHEAMLRLAEQGLTSKLYDLSPKRRITVPEQPDTATDGGVAVDELDVTTPVGDLAPSETVEEQLQLEEATGYIVDQSDAAELLPKKWTTEKLQTMQDKARMEEHQEGKLMKYFGYGMAAGFGMTLVALGVFWFLGQIGGGIF